VFDQLNVDLDTAAVDDRVKPILRYVKKLTLTPTYVTRLAPTSSSPPSGTRELSST
jgi:hypothetical protein